MFGKCFLSEDNYSPETLNTMSRKRHVLYNCLDVFFKETIIVTIVHRDIRIALPVMIKLWN